MLMRSENLYGNNKSEMNTDTTLRNISLLAFIVVMTIVAVNMITTNHYGRSNRQVVQQLADNDAMITYHQLHNMTTGETNGYKLIDLRSEDEFNEGHLPGAINIPYKNLLNKESLRTLRKMKEMPVLYGSSESQSQTALLLLIAKGIDKNILTVGGNYQTALKYAVQEFHPSRNHFREEKAGFDYPRFFRNGASARPSASPAGIIPAVQTDTQGAKGGC
jgi:rhodanese-related sulfurtransferase